MKVLHINSTKRGGGVAELLDTIANKLGHDWKVLKAPLWYFDYTKSLHNYLQGNKESTYISKNGSTKKTSKITRNELEEIKQMNEGIFEGYDVIVIHDPQPMPLIDLKKKGQKIIWRCHIDYKNSLPEIYSKYFKKIDAIVAHRKFEKLKHKNINYFKPGINPNADKNRKLDDNKYKELLEEMGIYKYNNNFKITEVSRFDPWKGQENLIKAFIEAKKEGFLKDAKLFLAGGCADDDPEGKKYSLLIKEMIKTPDIVVLENFSDLHINALQRFADLVVQPSIREGYGLTVSEALIKGTPVLATDLPAFKSQIKEGNNGYFFKTNEELKNKLIELHQNKAKLNIPMTKKVRTTDDLIADWKKLINSL